MKTPILFIKDEPEILALQSQIEEGARKAKEQCEFLSKRMDAIKAQWDKDAEIYWKDILNWIREKGKLPKNYSKDTHYLSTADGILSVISKDHDCSNFPSMGGMMLPSGLLKELMSRFTE